MRWIKNILIVVAAVVVGYNSVYFRNLDEYKSSLAKTEFNAATYAKTFWDTKLIPNLGQAVEITQLSEMLATEPGKTFDTYSHALGIGNLRYILVKGTGTVTAAGDDQITVSLRENKQDVILETEFIFGNAVRDATGLISINEFNNTMDFNNVSAEINRIIREKVLPPFKTSLKTGQVIEFYGAIELNKEHFDPVSFEVIPVQLTIK